MTQKETWFIILENEGKKGVGECGLLRGLSIDDRSDYEEKLHWACANITLGLNKLWESLIEFPSIQFGLETAFQSLASQDPFILYPSDFTNAKSAIPINGLVWMGDHAFMHQQLKQKLAEGFHCIKIKIGAIDFQKELELLHFIRQNYSPQQIEIRLDANGAFHPDTVLEKLIQLAKYNIHSIEQPIQKGQPSAMSALCKSSPIPIALDEELIGIISPTEKEQLIKDINPQYIILKPSFIGGFRGTQEWISLAQKHNIGWWITSALESNIGLNAIAQWTFLQNSPLPQGLGTGALYTNNFSCSLQVTNGQLQYNNKIAWDFPL